MKTILEKEEDDEEEKPLEIFSETLKNYVSDLKELQSEDKKAKQN